MKLIARMSIVVCLAALAVGIASPIHGQQGVPPRTIAVNASGAAAGAWAVRVETMLHEGTLEISTVQADTVMAGRVHERMDQRHEGLPVFGGQLVRQLNGRAVLSVSGRIFDNVSVPTVTPAIDADKARAIAEQQLGRDAVGDAPVLGILATSDAYVLVYRLTVRGFGDIRRYDVNASTGAIEGSQTAIRDQGAGAIGRGTGVLGDDKKVPALRVSSGYQTVDHFRPWTGYTYALDGSLGRFLSWANTLNLFESDLGFSSDNRWTDGALVDAHTYVGWTYDYYFKLFGRRGIDDRDFPVQTVVHPLSRSLAFSFPQYRGLFINNAFYLHPGLLVFGDGDGALFDYLSGALDIVAHELTHGITGFTSDLEYQDEPGALNEAFSDIIGAGAEFFHIKPGGRQKGPNWVLGEDVTHFSPGFIRSMQNPIAAGDPDHYSLRVHIGTPLDNGGVHINSGIINHAFYLAVAGGRNRVSGLTVAGIGTANIDRMLKIFYRAFVFSLGPLSQFSDARAETLRSAAELYGAGNERAQLLQAWNAVGVN